MRSVSRRFCGLIDHIVHVRLLRAASLCEWKLIIECYHPTTQHTEPYVFCEYLGTPGLSLDGARQSLDNPSRGTPSKLTELLARFKPTRNSPEKSTERSHPAGDIPGSRTMAAATASRPSVEESVSQTVKLDSHENFSQLMFMASLVKLGPRKGVFEALVEVFETKTIRVFRDWLRHQDQLNKARSRRRNEAESEIDGEPGEQTQDRELIWIDEHTKIAQLDIEAKELRWKKDRPILIMRDEDEAVSYRLELKGM